MIPLFATPAAAAAQLEDVKLVIESCGVPPASGEGAPILLEIADSGFAGDESLLVRQTLTPYGESELLVTYVCVVRVGDAVVTVRSYDPKLEGADPAFLRRLAVAASARIAGAD